MEFLKRHYEKLVLGLFLVGLLVGSWLLVKDLQKVGEGAGAPPELGDAPLHEALTADVFDFEKVLLSEKLDWVSAGDVEEGDLFEPRKYIRCADPECLYLIPISCETCPYCSAAQGPRRRGPKVLKEGEDNDGDSLPNEFEAKYDFLDPDNPRDAGADQDKDWFTNLEEHEAETSLTDQKEHPPLARRLRFIGSMRRSLDITFKNLIKNRAEDPQKWDIMLNVLEGKRLRTRIKRIGDSVGDYKIVAARFKEEKIKDPKMNNAERTVDRSEVDLQREGDEDVITLVVGQKSYEKGVIVGLLLITDSQGDPKKWPKAAFRADKPLVLKDAARQQETYAIVRVTSAGIVVKKANAEGEPEEGAEDIAVRRFNARLDLPRRAAARRAGTQMQENTGPAGAPREGPEGNMVEGEQGEAMMDQQQPGRMRPRAPGR